MLAPTIERPSQAAFSADQLPDAGNGYTRNEVAFILLDGGLEYRQGTTSPLDGVGSIDMSGFEEALASPATTSEHLTPPAPPATNRSRSPVWWDLIDTQTSEGIPAQRYEGSTPRAEAPTQPPAWRRALTYISHLATRAVKFGRIDNRSPDYIGSHRFRPYHSARHRPQPTAQLPVEVNPDVSMLQPQRPSAPSSEQPEQPSSAIPTLATEAPMPIAPSTELVHVPRAQAPVIDKAPAAILLEGLQAAGYDSVQAFEDAAYFATPAERIALGAVLGRIVRRGGRPWRLAGEQGNLEADEQFKQLTALAGHLATKHQLKPQTSPEERERRAARGDSEHEPSTIADLLAARQNLRDNA